MISRLSAIVVATIVASAPASAHGPHAMSGGKIGDPAKADRTVEVSAVENAFSLKSLDVRDGETVRFIVRNDGMDPHEFLIGTRSEHAEHLKAMRAMIEAQKKPGGTHAHAPPMMEHASGVMVAPGKTATFVWTFTRTADLEFACDIPGHYEDGMRGPINFSR